MSDVPMYLIYQDGMDRFTWIRTILEREGTCVWIHTTCLLNVIQSFYILYIVRVVYLVWDDPHVRYWVRDGPWLCTFDICFVMTPDYVHVHTILNVRWPLTIYILYWMRDDPWLCTYYIECEMTPGYLHTILNARWPLTIYILYWMWDDPWLCTYYIECEMTPDYLHTILNVRWPLTIYILYWMWDDPWLFTYYIECVMAPGYLHTILNARWPSWLFTYYSTDHLEIEPLSTCRQKADMKETYKQVIVQE